MSGRVIVDAFAYYRSNTLVKPTMRGLRDTEGENATNEEVENEEEAGGNEEADGDEEVVDHEEEADEEEVDNNDEVDNGETEDEEPPMGSPASATQQSMSKDRAEDLAELSDAECLMTSPWLIGYDLKQKQWGMCSPRRIAALVLVS